MTRRLLIANRGEIACRIMRSAQAMGYVCIAVYARADACAPYVRMADEAYLLEGERLEQTYLNQDQLLKVMIQAHVDCVHPGYGFLSENADFAQKCTEAGIVFVGPTPQVIRLMGSKTEAKAAAVAAGLPVVPGYAGEDQSDETLSAEATKVGYPLMIKATYGGGGKGMRIVLTQAAFREALHACRREAIAAFGRSEVLLERYISHPRHVEVQVFGDHQGNVVHLFDRDCSLQRRHQKILEEAPAIGIPENVRNEMLEAAVRLAQSVGYIGAGTVEFLLEPTGAFYFMEMNTRLQVEHPVTEAITGQDLVAWQLTVAARNPLPLKQSEILSKGHSVEVRLYAEDPFHDFMPATGRLSVYEFPKQVRVDQGYGQGDQVTISFDPLLAKVIAYGSNRGEALRQLNDALKQVRVFGVTTNQPLLVALTAHPKIKGGNYDTGVFEAEKESFLSIPKLSHLQAVAAWLLASVPALSSASSSASSRKHRFSQALLGIENLAIRDPGATQKDLDSHSQDDGTNVKPILPWQTADLFQMNIPSESHQCFTIAGSEVSARVRVQNGKIAVTINDTHKNPNCETIHLDQSLSDVNAWRCPHTHSLWLLWEGCLFQAKPLATKRTSVEKDAGVSQIVAPLPGKVTHVWVTLGEKVLLGAPLVTLEAMKMEHTLKASAPVTITQIIVGAGQGVSEGDLLMMLEGESP